jgi:hypothetical protein
MRKTSKHILGKLHFLMACSLNRLSLSPRLDQTSFRSTGFACWMRSLFLAQEKSIDAETAGALLCRFVEPIDSMWGASICSRFERRGVVSGRL